MRICPKCNEEYDDDTSFCLTDGTVLLDEATHSEEILTEMDETEMGEETVLKNLEIDLAETDESEIEEDESILELEDESDVENLDNESEDEILDDEDEIEDETLESETLDDEDEIEGLDEETVVTESADKATASKGSSKLSKSIIAALVLTLVFGGIGFAYWKTQQNSFSYQVPTKITKEDLELLVKDFNPMQLKQLSETPEQKKELIDNVKELLAIASQAEKDGVLKDKLVRQELQSMQETLLASTFDQKVNADKGPGQPFSSITEEQVKKFWDATDTAPTLLDRIGLGENNKDSREKKFQMFLDTKIQLAQKSGQLPKDQKPSEEELKQAREAFAKSQISYNLAKQKLANLGSLPEAERKDWQEFEKKTEIQTKLQMAQFLTQNYVQETLSKKFEVTEKEIEDYTKKHPELTNSEEKKKKAEEVLEKVNNGGDFAALAKEFSEDPGSKDKGGLYEGVAKGQFAPEFEVAALALKPGEVAKEVVKTNFGYHIIKLVKKGESKGADGKPQETFDARHILISTMIKDPDNPQAKEMPADQYVKTKLEKEKQEKIINEIKANNPIQVAEDFVIPKVSDEEIKKMQEQQMEQMQKMQEMQKMQQGGDPDGAEKPKGEEPKKEDKK